MSKSTVLVEYLGGPWDGHCDEIPLTEAQKLLACVVNPPKRTDSPTEDVLPQQIHAYQYDNHITEDIYLYCRYVMVFPLEEWLALPKGITSTINAFAAEAESEGRWRLKPVSFHIVQGRFYRIETQAKPVEGSFARTSTGITAILYVASKVQQRDTGKCVCEEILRWTIRSGRLMTSELAAKDPEVILDFKAA